MIMFQTKYRLRERGWKGGREREREEERGREGESSAHFEGASFYTVNSMARSHSGHCGQLIRPCLTDKTVSK